MKKFLFLCLLIIGMVITAYSQDGILYRSSQRSIFPYNPSKGQLVCLRSDSSIWKVISEQIRKGDTLQKAVDSGWMVSISGSDSESSITENTRFVIMDKNPDDGTFADTIQSSDRYVIYTIPNDTGYRSIVFPATSEIGRLVTIVIEGNSSDPSADVDLYFDDSNCYFWNLDPLFPQKTDNGFGGIGYYAANSQLGQFGSVTYMYIEQDGYHAWMEIDRNIYDMTIKNLDITNIQRSEVIPSYKKVNFDCYLVNQYYSANADTIHLPDLASLPNLVGKEITIAKVDSLLNGMHSYGLLIVADAGVILYDGLEWSDIWFGPSGTEAENTTAVGIMRFLGIYQNSKTYWVVTSNTTK